MRSLNTLRTRGYRSFSTSNILRSSSSSSSTATYLPPSLPRSDLSYRALLRNLRLLQGMRTDTPKYKVIITGYDAQIMAQDMQKLEPCIEFDVVGDSFGVDMDRINVLKGKRYDSLIVSQPYHTLPHASSILSLKQTLHPEDGTLGFVWTRPTLQEPWTRVFTDVLHQYAKNSEASSTVSQLPLLKAEQTPMTWFDEVDVTQYGLKPVKHRKFVEKLQGTYTTLLPFLRILHDHRLPSQGNNEIYNHTVQTLLQRPELQSTIESKENTLSLDLHAFHTSIVPSSSPKK